jgi:glycosyltransferase involved in cell wall biosynthesis
MASERSPLPPEATVVITTRDRKDLLRRAVRSALRQTAVIDVIVMDDGSTDGTPEMLGSEFPQVMVRRSDEPRGCIAARNAAAGAARGAVIVSIDDDAEFESPETVAQTLVDFDHPRIGAVAIPFVDLRRDRTVRQLAPAADAAYAVSCFSGSAHALRKDVFVRLGGYASNFIQRGEEKDYCLRMMAAGYVVRAGRAAPLVHREAEARIGPDRVFYDTRNDVWYAWRSVPMPFLLGRLVTLTLRALANARDLPAARAVAYGLAAGWTEVLRGHVARAPASRSTYRVHRRLHRQGPLPLDVFERKLPPGA